MTAIRVLMYDAKQFDILSFSKVLQAQKNASMIKIDYTDVQLSESTADQARGYNVVCIFVNCIANDRVIEKLAKNEVKLIALRCAGFNNVDIHYATLFNTRVVRVPAYSPYGVAEYAVSMLLCLVRRIHHSFLRVRAQNFSIDGFVGFDVHGKTAAVIGTGKIGKCAISILVGMGCRVVAFDVYEDLEASKELGFTYHSLEDVLKLAHVVFLFAPLTQQTHHLINERSIRRMQDRAFLINCSRGALIDSKALFDGLISGKLGGAALDVYENEKEYFFRDQSNKSMNDELLAKLIRMGNVLLTSHQAYLTNEALENIAEVTIKNIFDYFNGTELENEVKESDNC